MSKFIMSLGDGAYEVLQLEATRRWISVQELLRAVIIPEWVGQYWDAQKALVRHMEHPLIPIKICQSCHKSILDGETWSLRYDDRARRMEPLHEKCWHSLS
jgi:hypothetical protein